MVTVALDIGHGSNTFPPSKGIYKDGKTYPEHSFNAKLVQAIDPLLRANGINTIIYQKPNKSDVPLLQRTNYYNAQGVDLVYSIHANYNGNSNVNGRCAFYWHTSSKSKKLAETVIDEIKKAGYSTHGNGLHPSERGSWTNLHICRETKMPAVLVENGFMSGNKDFDLVFGDKQASYIKDMAQVHAKAICRYFGINYDGETPKQDETKKEKNKKDKPKQQTSTPASGRVESKVNGLRFYNKPSWSDKDVVGSVNKGYGFPTIVKKVKVGSAYQYQVKNSKGATYYITAASKYVKVVGGSSKKKTKPKLKGDQQTNSVVDYLKSIKVNSSYANRKKLAAKHDIKNYTGTAAQNAKLLKKLRG